MLITYENNFKFTIFYFLSRFCREIMSFIYDENVTIQFDASCSTDPDLSPENYGPASQGTLIYMFMNVINQNIIIVQYISYYYSTPSKLTVALFSHLKNLFYLKFKYNKRLLLVYSNVSTVQRMYPYNRTSCMDYSYTINLNTEYYISLLLYIV